MVGLSHFKDDLLFTFCNELHFRTALVSLLNCCVQQKLEGLPGINRTEFQVIKCHLLTDCHLKLHLTWCLARQHGVGGYGGQSTFQIKADPLTLQINNTISQTNQLSLRLGLVTIQSNFRGNQYIEDVPWSVVLHFDNHAPTTRSVFTDVNARPHRFCTVTTCTKHQHNVMMTFSWLNTSPDLNLLEQIWDLIGIRYCFSSNFVKYTQ